MQFLKTKEQVLLERLGSVNESVFKMGDTYKVKTTIDIPKSLINQFVSKAKKENNIDARENWSDTDLAEMFVNYICANYLNSESLPVTSILGESSESNQSQTIETTVAPEEVNQAVSEEPIQEPIEQPLDDTGVSSEIENEF